MIINKCTNNSDRKAIFNNLFLLPSGEGREEDCRGNFGDAADSSLPSVVV